MPNGFVMVNTLNGHQVIMPNISGSRINSRRPAIFQLGGRGDELPQVRCTECPDLKQLLQTPILKTSWVTRLLSDQVCQFLRIADQGSLSAIASSEGLRGASTTVGDFHEASTDADNSGASVDSSNEESDTESESDWDEARVILDAERASASVIQEIVHNEPAAQIPASVAAEQVAQQSKRWVPRTKVSGEESSEEGMDEYQALMLLRVTRAPRDLQERLQNGPELQHARSEMQRHGLSSHLPSGATIFVLNPEEHAAAQRIVKEQHLRVHHMVVQQSLLHLVREAVQSLRSRLNVRVRSQETIAYLSGSRAVVTERTFLTDHQRFLRNPASVAQSTTEAHEGVNPRRWS